MGFVRTAFAMVCLACVLSSCNTTDALTPQVDVGAGHYPNSNPVTERDLQQMSENRQPTYPPQPQTNGSVAGGPISEQPLPPPQGASQASQMDGQVYGRPGPGAPPSTLEQQAATLPQGNGEDQSGYTNRRPRSSGLAEPSQQQAEIPQQAGTVAQAQAGETIRFLPIIGAPLGAVTPLSRQLGAEARARGIVIRGSSDVAAGHVLKGYFSSVAGGGTITVTYVWDVLDANGARLNRIQGQESFPGNASDPWSAVPPSVMQNIATKTMDSYTRWRAGP